MPYGAPHGLQVGTPSRALSRGGDEPRPWPPAQDNDAGTVAIPSRTAVLEGFGVPELPSPVPALDGIGGMVDTGQFSPPPFDWSQDAWGGGGPRYPLAEVLGRPVTNFVRRYFANLGGIIGFDTLRPGRTGWTTNLAAEDSSPLVPGDIPFYWKREVYTLREPFDKRVQADYLPHMISQKSQAPREIALGVQATTPQMLKPHFPLLTRWQQPEAWGDRTLTLDPMLVSPLPEGVSPYAG